MLRILIPLFFVVTFSSKAQIQSKLYVDGKLLDERQFSDSLRLVDHLKQLQITWINDGFFFSGVDSVIENGKSASIYLHKGNKMKAKLPAFKGRGLQSYFSRLLKSYSNSGYPFASILLDSAEVSGEFLEGKTLIVPGPKISYDSAYFFTRLKTNHSYIYQLIDIVPGASFSEKDYRFIAQKIERSPFLSIQRPIDLSFKNNKAKTFLDIKEDASSTFQGVIGIQQAQNGKTTAVGALELDIQNLFRSGKQFRFAWERFAEESQNLSIFYKHPFFLDSRISPSFSFDLLRQDTIFLTRSAGLGLHTFIAPRVELFAKYESINGTLLSSDLETIGNSGLADFKRKVYSLQLSKGHLSSLDRLAKGIIWELSTSGGIKNIERNLNLPDSYYDSIQIETDFYQFEATLAYQFEILKRQSFFHHIKAGILENEELLRNELYRLGGLNSLRGFNEKEIFAKNYILSRTEFRSFFENKSYAYIFYDHLFFGRESQSDQPYGLGLGFALATATGQFNFALAVGHSANQDISFSTMKAHFGYISRF